MRCYEEETIRDLIQLDIDYYIHHHPDLYSFSATEALSHYCHYGYEEGRQSADLCVREHFLEAVDGKSILEIGPFANPLLKGERVKYIDILDHEALVKRAEEINLIGKNPYIDSSDIPEIDYIMKDGSMKFIADRFDGVISAHNIEHQPDLISHLNEVSDLLNKGGKYYLIIPNSRYCFDAELPTTNISDVFDAYYDKRKVHTIGSVIEHKSLTTHNDSLQHWQARLEQKTYRRINEMRLRKAIRLFQEADGGYYDVHAWQFEPVTFSDIINTLINLGYITFSKVTCYGPVFGRNEFTAILEK